MNNNRRYSIRSLLRSAAIFATAGLIGALVILLVHFTIGLGDITYELAFLIWPTQMLVAYESEIGKPLALVLAITSNIFVFAAIGLLIGSWIVSPRRAIISYLLLVAIGFCWAFWGAGLDMRFLNPAALLIGFLFYAAPVLVVLRTART